MVKSGNLLFINGVLCLSLLIISSCSNSSIATSEITTPSPTLTTPTITPSPSITPTAIAFNFPQWMRNSDTAILASLIRDGSKKAPDISFFNASTGEKFELEMPITFGGFFWYDNMHFGFLSDDFQVMHLVDVSNGQVIEKNVTTKSTQLLSMDDSFIPLTIRQDPLSPSEYIFDYAFSYWGSPYSIDTRYFAESDRSNNEEPITVTDLETGQIIWESNDSDGYWNVHFLWSPVKSSYLAIVVGKPSNTGFEFPIHNTTLIVIDVETGKTISSYKVDAGRIQWSPDGTKILYRNAISDYRNFGFGFTEAPCFFDLETRKESCIWRIPNRPLLNGKTLITSDDYQWGSDGKSIYFTYSYSSPNGMSADICNYNLVDGSFTCPTHNLPEFSGWNIDWRYG